MSIAFMLLRIVIAQRFCFLLSKVLLCSNTHTH